LKASFRLTAAVGQPELPAARPILLHVSNVKNILISFQLRPVLMELITFEKIDYLQANRVALPMMFVTASIALGPTSWYKCIQLFNARRAMTRGVAAWYFPGISGLNCPLKGPHHGELDPG
jgi:hypothetical protein